MTSKDRAALRSFANQLSTIQQIGHLGISEELIKNIDNALTARELIKISTLENCDYSAKEAAEILAAATNSYVIQIIGSKLVLYRHNPKINKYGID